MRVKRKQLKARKRKDKREWIFAVIVLTIAMVGVSISHISRTSQLTSKSQTKTEPTTQQVQSTTTAKEYSEEVNNILDSMSLEEKVNQMFFITPEALTNVDVVTAAGNATKTALENHPVGGIIYFTPNFENEKQTKEMISNIKKYSNDICKVPLFIGVDEEGGTVARLANSQNINVQKVSNMSEIGKSKDEAKAYEVGQTIGNYLSDYGFNIDFAPDADVITNSENQVVKDRSFGTDANIVSKMAIQVSKGLKDSGIYSCYKHFPDHGATKEDTHEGFASIDKTMDELRQSEILPFVNAINAGADFIMVGHISVPKVIGDNTPASLSSVMINDTLKKAYGFDGIVVTDSLSMGAITKLGNSSDIAVKAINAGVDMLLMPENFEMAYNGVLNAVKSGEISEARINESVKKIIDKKLNMQ